MHPYDHRKVAGCGTVLAGKTGKFKYSVPRGSSMALTWGTLRTPSLGSPWQGDRRLGNEQGEEPQDAVTLPIMIRAPITVRNLRAKQVVARCGSRESLVKSPESISHQYFLLFYSDHPRSNCYRVQCYYQFCGMPRFRFFPCVAEASRLRSNERASCIMLISTCSRAQVRIHLPIHSTLLHRKGRIRMAFTSRCVALVVFSGDAELH